LQELVIFESNVLNIILVCALVFFARTLDVSIGTIRIIFVSRGRKFPASLCGFFETMIWLFAMSQILQNLTNPLYYVAFAAGFATGTYVGIMLEEKLAMGMYIVTVITRDEAPRTLSDLREAGFGVTNIKAEGRDGPVDVFHTVIKRTELRKVIKIIRKFNEKAFYTIEDLRYVREPVHLPHASMVTGRHLGLRKGK